MDDEVSSCLVHIKEKYRNVSSYHTKQYPCHLKTVNVHGLELLESVVEKESGNSGDVRQVRIPYNRLFDPIYGEITLKPNYGTAPRKVILIQGEAAVGKTMLCMSIVEEWASGKLFQEFQLVLLLPLSSRNVASASSLSGLLNVLYADFKDDTSSKVAKYLAEKESHYNILLIADGWEELQDSQCQAGSFLHSLLFSSDIIPTSSTTVLITSRPGIQKLSIMQSANDRLITLTGFDRRAVESVVQSEFAGDLRRIWYLTAQLNDNPLVANVCSTPLNLAIVCHVGDAEPLPDTMTKLYSKLIWTLVSVSITHPHENSLQFSSHQDLPEELQQSWWQACELAFRNIEKDHNNFPLSDAAFTSSKLNEISCFGLTKPIAETEDMLSFSFVHPCFEEYLAALHLAKQPKEVQLKFMHELVVNEECKSKIAITFWHFFISNYAHQVSNLNPDVVDQVLKILLAAYCTTKQEYYMNLCHLSYEAKHDVVNQKVVEAISIMGTGVLRFCQSCDAYYDFNSMVYVLQNVTQESKVEINFQDCNLRSKHVYHLANALYEKSSIVQIKGLNLSGNRLSNSLAVDFFNKGAAALKSLKVLILRNCDIGTFSDIKAILSTLIKSTSPTLTHFDLSFNRISISFLQVLQQHLECYGTFESLQNLGLKGSLNSDVTLSFLANFSDSLSSKCKYLRRLDLSENNLGEPGNPDLCKVISQLLSLGRDFNLCLNDEYMSDVHDEFVYVMKDSIKKKGTIKHTIAHGVIVGPGRSGKNTLMSRLMGNGPPKPDTVSPSTGVLENIIKVEVKKLCTVATAVSNLEWKKLQYDEEALELIMTTARHHSATTTISKPSVTKYIIKEQTKSPIITSAKSRIPPKRPGGPKLFIYKIGKLLKKFTSSKARKSYQSPMGKVQEKEKSAIVYTPNVEPVDIFKQAVKLRGMDALQEHLESSWSLYLTNTGGQIEFQEHLPFLVCGPSIFFVTFPLHYDLGEPYHVCYEYPDGRVETYKSPGTLLQELLQTLATISYSHFTSGRQKDSEARIKRKVFFIGTHKDCLPENVAEEIIQRKDQVLQSYVRQTALFDQDAIQFAEHPELLIFAVNNLSDDDDEFQKIRSSVQTTVERDEFTVECPSSWLILSLILRAKHKSDQVLTFDKCFSIARECGISDHEELSQALSFIHSRLGLVRFFDVKDLNTLVVIDPQVLFDKITDLIVRTFTVENVGIKKTEDFYQRGIIPVTDMQNISDRDENGSDSQLPFKWLTNLLNYLRIAAKFRDRDGDKYFFPSALCHAPKSDSKSPHAYLWPSLLVGFKSGFCPRGIPGALIKYLMTNEMRSKRCWNIIPNKIFKNEVSFAIQAHGNITLRILPTHLEISYYSDSDSVGGVSEEDMKEDELVKETCEMAYMQIKKAMSIVTSQCMECNYFYGFYCTLSTCQAHKHLAEIEWDGKNPFKVVCKVANKRGDLPKGYEIWNLQKNQKTGKAQLDKVIDADGHGVPKHLGRIADLVTEWEGRISDELKLTPADVASIHTKHPRNQSREALYIWKRRLGSEATYRRLMNVFEQAGFQNHAEIVRSIICEDESEVDDSSDYEDLEPITQPETYPNIQSNPLPSPKHSLTRRVSSWDEFSLINLAAKSLPPLSPTSLFSESHNLEPQSQAVISDVNIDHFSKESELCAPRGEDLTVEASLINLPPMEVAIEGPGSDIPQEQEPTPNIETTRAPSGGNIESSADESPRTKAHQTTYFDTAKNTANVPFLDHQMLECDFSGREYTNVDHDITLRIPEGAVAEGEKVHFEIAVAMYGPFIFPEGTKVISPILWLCLLEEAATLRKPVEIVLPHYLSQTGDVDQYGIGFLKANHSDYEMNDSCQISYNFRPLVTDKMLVYRENQGYGIILTDHFCYVCLTAPDRPVITENTNYCLARVCTSNNSESLQQVIFCTLYHLPTCITAVKEQYPQSVQKHSMPFKFKYPDGSLRIQVEQSSEGYIIAMDPRNGEISASSIDFRSFSNCDVKLMHELKTYPPRVEIQISIHKSSTSDFVIPVKINGCAKDGQLDVDLLITRDSGGGTANDQLNVSPQGGGAGGSAVVAGDSSTLAPGSELLNVSKRHKRSRSEGAIHNVITERSELESPSAGDRALNKEMLQDICSSASSWTTQSHLVRYKINMSEAYRATINIAAEWKNIGTLLNVPQSTLKTIDHDEGRNGAKSCLREMLAVWLQRTPSWSELADAVEEFNPSKAQEIRDKYCRFF